MNIFDFIPQDLFSVLASPNKTIYSDTLLVLHDAFQENLKIPKDTLFTMIRGRLESALVYSNFDEEGIEEEESQDLSGKARFLIRKLKEKGWIDIERDDSFSEYIIIPEYSIRIIELLKSLVDRDQIRGFSYVYDTYSSLKLAHEDESSGAYEKMMALSSACDNTAVMIKTLKKVYHNVNRYVQQLIDKDDINEILAVHYDDFYHRIIETHIQPLKIIDSIPKYKNPIYHILNAWLENDELINSIVQASIAEKRAGTLEEHRHEILSKIFFIKETYETIEHDYLNEIDDKVRKYTRATTKKIEYLTNTDRTVQGNLIYLLNALANKREDDNLLEQIQATLHLYKQEYLSENSLYHNKSASRKSRRDPVLVEDLDDDLNEKIRNEYRNTLNGLYGKPKVLEYMERLFGDSPVAFSSDMDLYNDRAYILSLLVVLHGNDRGIFYRPEFMEGMVGNRRYVIPEIRFERKESK